MVYKNKVFKTIKIYFLLLVIGHICLVKGCRCGPSRFGTANNMISSNGSCNLLTISCMQGKEKCFIARFDLSVKDTDLLSQGYLVAIGLPAKGLWSEQKWKDYLSRKVLRCINDGAKKLWAEDGTFIALDKLDKTGNQSFSIGLSKTNYCHFLSQDYNIYILSFDPKVANGRVNYNSPIKLEGSYQPLPDYSAIGLKAEHAIREEMAGQVKWRFQGSVKTSCGIDYSSNVKVGFLLVEVKGGLSPWDLIQKRITSGLDHLNSLFNGVIVVPGRLSQTDCLITSYCSSKDLPSKGSFKLFAYLMQGNHYYISQMQDVCSNSREKTPKNQTSPPIITFEDYSLKLPNLKIILNRADSLGDINDVTFEGLDIKYFLNGVQTEWPIGLKACLLLRGKKSDQSSLLPLDFNTVASLEKELELGKNSSMTKDRKFCLIANKAKKLDSLSFPCFGLHKIYDFFICGFSERDKSLQYYTDIDALSIGIIESQKSSLRRQTGSNGSSISPQKAFIKNLNGVSENIEATVGGLNPDSTSISNEGSQKVKFYIKFSGELNNLVFENEFKNSCNCNFKSKASKPIYNNNTWSKGTIKIQSVDLECILDNSKLKQAAEYTLKQFLKNKTSYSTELIYFYADCHLKIKYNRMNQSKGSLPNAPRLYHWLYDQMHPDNLSLCQGHSL